MFGALNNVPKSQMLNVWHCKRTPNIIAKQKSFIKKKIMAFMFLVMLVIGMRPWVWQLSYTSSNFSIMIIIVMLVAQGGNMQLIG
jgi:hypothetical protein